MSIRNFFRSKRSRQCDLVEVSVKIKADGSIEGIDKSFIVNSQKQATGEYVIECGENSNSQLFVSHLIPKSGFLAHIEAQDDKSIEVHAITLAAITGVKASLIIQDITYQSVLNGGNDISIEYTAGVTAGSEVVTVVGNKISIQIEDGVSTATQVKAAFDAEPAAIALATATISGVASDSQGIAAEANLAGGAVAALAGGKADCDIDLTFQWFKGNRIY